MICHRSSLIEWVGNATMARESITVWGLAEAIGYDATPVWAASAIKLSANNGKL